MPDLAGNSLARFLQGEKLPPEDIENIKVALNYLLAQQKTVIQYPKSAERFHDSATQTIGTPGWTHQHDAAQNYGFNSFQTTPANGDAFENYFFLRPGSYTLYVMGITFSNRGLLDWYMDGIPFVTGQDWYSAAIAYNVLKSAAVTVSGGGLHTLKGVINGKNAASSSFYYALTKYWFA